MTTAELQQAFEQAERDAQDLMAQKDEIRGKLREATDRSARAQAAWREALVVDALRGRPDGDALATRFGVALEGRE